MVSKILSKSLIRELLDFKAQIISIALIVGIGVGVYFGFSTTYESLLVSRDQFYHEYNFPHLFANLSKSPNYLLSRIKQIEGVEEVEGRIEQDALMTLKHREEPGVAHFISIPDGTQPKLSQLFILKGRLPSAQNNEEIVVSESFFKANQLKLGDSLQATLNGRQKNFIIRGVGVSPEHIIALQPGVSFPDDEHFALIWINQSALAHSLDMKSSFNSVAIKVNPNFFLPQIKQKIEKLLERYGVREILDRDKQLSAIYVREELKQLNVQASTIPIIFFLVAAFILNIVISRLIRSQRPQIATLKSIGFHDFTISQYYFAISVCIVLLGAVFGLMIGTWIGKNMVMLYAYYYHFPLLVYKFTYPQLLLSLLFALLTAFLGTYSSLRKIFSLPPAEAMKPPAPQSYHFSWLEKYTTLAPLKLRMVARGVIANPLRTTMVGLGLSFSIVLLILGLFWQDSLQELILTQYGFRHKGTGQINLTKSLPMNVVRSISRLPGITQAEGYRMVPIKIYFNNQEETSSLQGLPKNFQLLGIFDPDLKKINLPNEGFHLSQNLVNKLGIKQNDKIEVEILEGRKRKITIRVQNIFNSLYEQNIFTSRQQLARIMQTDDLVNQILFRSYQMNSSLYAHLKQMPTVMSISYKDAAMKMFNETSAKFLLVFATIFSLFAGAIAFGITYNNLRVTLAERDWEISTLMILGFKHFEVFKTLMAEIFMLLLGFIPLGCLLGYLNARWLLLKLSMEEFPIPFAVSNFTYLLSIFIIILSSTLSGYFIFRRIKGLDLVATLKSRG